MDTNRFGHINGRQWKSAAGYLLAAGVGVGVGACAMFLYDPNRGKARRHQLRDQAVSTFRATADTVSKRVEDAGNRAKGAVLDARGKLRQYAAEIPDAKLAGRVRAKLGHLSHEAGKIRVDAHNGHVALYGHLDEPGFDRIVTQLASIPGVVSIDDYTYTAPQRSRTFPQMAKMAAIPAVVGGIVAGVRALGGR